MLLASKVVKKNLIKDFLSTDWFVDYNSGGGTMSVDPVNPHKMSFTITNAQGRLIWIPVEIGKTYTFSFKSMNCLYRFYKRKVGNHDVNMVLIQDGNAGKPDTYTFTPDDTYKGFITLRLTHSLTGTYTVENLQLEVGSKTEFEPYTLVNPNASVPPVADKQPKTNLIPISSDWENGSVNAVDGTFIPSTNRIKQKTKIPVISGNTYKITHNVGYLTEMFYYNNDVYVNKLYGWGFTPNFITIPQNVNGVFITFKKITEASISPSDLSNMGVIFYNTKDMVNPVATLYPKKNVYDKINNAFEVGSIASATGLDSPLNYVMRAKGYIAVKPNTTYCFTKPTNYNQIAPYPFDRTKGYLGNGLRPTITVDGVRCKFTTPLNCYFIRWQFNSPDTNYVMTQSELNLVSQTFQIEEGSYPTDYEPYQLSNLRSV